MNRFWSQFQTIFFDKPLFLCDKCPQFLNIESLRNSELLVERIFGRKSGENENKIKKRLHSIFFSILIEQGNCKKWEVREYEDDCTEDEEETDTSTHILMIQKNK